MIQPPLRISLFLLLLCVLLVLSPVNAISLSPGNSFSGAQTIANGDPVYIHGIATGHPSNGLQVWLFGNNYVKITTVSTNADNSYEYELKPADTRSLAPGQYFVLIQHPMMNGEFDIYYDAGTGSVINRQLGTGFSIFQLTGAGSLQSPAGANALMQAINSQNIDDTFASTSFIVGPPTAFINPVGDHAVGEQFIISGSTNLAAGDKLMVEVTSSSFKPTYKSQSAHNLTVLDEVCKVFHDLWIQSRSQIPEIGANMIEHFLVVIEIRSDKCQQEHDKRNQVDEDIKCNS